jgi:NAD-dependent deacetylase sirtuin 4
MRISIPSIPENAIPRAKIEYTLKAATSLVSDLLTSSNGKALIMTGAGVSVDSGISPYRGEDGHYTVHKTYRPIFFHEFTEDTDKGHLFRQRYWSRSFLGYPPVCE